MARRPTLRAQAALVTIAMTLLLSAPAHATWAEPGATDATWSCGDFSYLTELRFMECVKRSPSTNVEYVQSIMMVSSSGTTARAVSGSTETFAGPGRGYHLSYGDCGPTVIAGPGHRWCYGQTKPVPKGTPIYGRGDLSQAGESSFAYSPTPFTAPTPPSGAAQVLDARINYDYRYPPGGRYTVLTHLSVEPARVGSTIRLRCRGRGCPFKTKTRTVTQSTAKRNLLRYLHHAKLRRHARLEVQVTKPGTIGRSRVLTIRSGGRVRRTDRCLMAGDKPAKCQL